MPTEVATWLASGARCQLKWRSDWPPAPTPNHRRQLSLLARRVRRPGSQPNRISSGNCVAFAGGRSGRREPVDERLHELGCLLDVLDRELLLDRQGAILLGPGRLDGQPRRPRVLVTRGEDLPAGLGD